MICKCGCELEMYFISSPDGTTTARWLHKDIKLNGRTHCIAHRCANPRPDIIKAIEVKTI